MKSILKPVIVKNTTELKITILGWEEVVPMDFKLHQPFCPLHRSKSILFALHRFNY